MNLVNHFRLIVFCRFCKASKHLTHSLSIEDSTLLRNIDNYMEDVQKNDFSQTGIYKESILNQIQSFHVTSNFSIDLMHDIYLRAFVTIICVT